MSDDDRVSKPFKFVTGTIGPRGRPQIPSAKKHGLTWPRPCGTYR
jgi:hypothetical protein